jgi:hypothetical protein
MAALLRLAPVYALFGLLKHFVALDTLARWAWRDSAAPRDAARERRMTARIVRLAHLFGAERGDCLHRSLLLYRELSGAGANPLLTIGFRRDDAGLKGHAWVVVDGEPVAETRDSLAAFTAALTYTAGGLRKAALSKPSG